MKTPSYEIAILSAEEISLLCRGLVSLHSEIECWQKSKIGLLRRKNQHASLATGPISRVEILLQRLSNLEISEE